MSSTEYSSILVERRGAVAIVTLNRPQALNALNAGLISELGSAFDELEADAAIGAIVLTGNDKAFAAGADIKEMAGKTYMQAYAEDFITRGWERACASSGGCSTRLSRPRIRKRAWQRSSRSASPPSAIVELCGAAVDALRRGAYNPALPEPDDAACRIINPPKNGFARPRSVPQSTVPG